MMSLIVAVFSSSGGFGAHPAAIVSTPATTTQKYIFMTPFSLLTIVAHRRSFPFCDGRNTMHSDSCQLLVNHGIIVPA